MNSRRYIRSVGEDVTNHYNCLIKWNENVVVEDIEEPSTLGSPVSRSDGEDENTSSIGRDNTVWRTRKNLMETYVVATIVEEIKWKRSVSSLEDDVDRELITIWKLFTVS